MTTAVVPPNEASTARAAATDAGTVINCYTVFDKFFPAAGLLDLTEGIYHGDPGTSYEEAQRSQAEYLLDQMRCKAGTRVLDIGCGYGTLLDQVRQRGGRGVGITISPEQVNACRRRGHQVHLLDWQRLGPEWNGQFDAAVANGSLEHFVQPRQAAAGLDDGIYRRLFQTVHRVLDPESASRQFVTTAIHFARCPQARDLARSALAFRWGSDNFHYALLERSFGGWYPVPGQLERCAGGQFDLAAEVDGTEDYHFTSEEWLRRMRRELKSWRAPGITARSLPVLVRHPIQLCTMLLCMLGCESWCWQFRGPAPPTRLLRQTWEYRA